MTGIALLNKRYKSFNIRKWDSILRNRVQISDISSFVATGNTVIHTLIIIKNVAKYQEYFRLDYLVLFSVFFPNKPISDGNFFPVFFP